MKKISMKKAGDMAFNGKLKYDNELKMGFNLVYLQSKKNSKNGKNNGFYKTIIDIIE